MRRLLFLCILFAKRELQLFFICFSKVYLPKAVKEQEYKDFQQHKMTQAARFFCYNFAEIRGTAACAAPSIKAQVRTKEKVSVLKTTESQVQMPNRKLLPAGVRAIIQHILAFLGGLLLASLQVSNSFSPFGVAYLAAVPIRYIFSAGAGAAAGYLLTLDSVSALRYTAALLSAGILSRLVREFERLRNFRLLPSCIACMVIFLTGMAVLFSKAFQIREFFAYLGEAAAAFMLAYFFSCAVCSAREFLRTDKLSVRALPSVCATAFLFLLSVSDIALFRISAARIVALYLILLFSWLYRETGGAVAGISAAIAFMCDPAVGFSAFAYAAAGMLSGMFAHSKRIFAALVLVGTFTVTFLFSGGDTAAIYLPIESVFAAILFVITPKMLLSKLSRAAAQTVDTDVYNTPRAVFLAQLDSATAAVEEMSESVKAISSRLKCTASAKEQVCILRVKEEVCADCGRKSICWDKHARDTLRALEQTAVGMHGNAALRESGLPPTLQTRCIRQTSLVESLNRNAVRMAERTAAQMKIDEIRQISAEQFSALADILREFTIEAGRTECFDETASQQICAALENELHIKPTSVLCAYNAEGKIRVELSLSKTDAPAREPLRQCLEYALRRKLELPDIRENETDFHLAFCEQTVFRVETAAASITAANEQLCGDSYESFYDGRGNYTAILSDGMGQGMRAALDSTMAVTMTAKLLKAGIGCHSALKMVNTALMLKAGDESLATLDILQINLYTGKATFYKAGAAKSLIRRQNKYMEIKKASLPAGILREVRFACVEGQLLADDLIILASDGVFDHAEVPFKRALNSVHGEPCSTVVKKLAEAAKKKNNGIHGDDITVLALRIGQNIKE